MMEVHKAVHIIPCRSFQLSDVFLQHCHKLVVLAIAVVVVVVMVVVMVVVVLVYPWSDQNRNRFSDRLLIRFLFDYRSILGTIWETSGALLASRRCGREREIQVWPHGTNLEMTMVVLSALPQAPLSWVEMIPKPPVCKDIFESEQRHLTCKRLCRSSRSKLIVTASRRWFLYCCL